MLKQYIVLNIFRQYYENIYKNDHYLYNNKIFKIIFDNIYHLLFSSCDEVKLRYFLVDINIVCELYRILVNLILCYRVPIKT